MKRVISILIVTVMVIAIASVAVSAEVRFRDPFDEWTQYWVGWDLDDHGGDLNVLTQYNGENVLEGWPEAVVHQGYYSNDEVAGKGYENSGSALIQGTVWVDVMCELVDNEDGGAGLWWKNTYHEKHEDAEYADTFLLWYYPGSSTVKFIHEAPGQETDEEKIVVEWSDPRQLGENLGKPITLGLRVEAGKVSAFVDGDYIGSYEDATLGIDPCPVLLWNGGVHVYWDNYCVGDLNELLIPGALPVDSTPSGGDDSANEPTPTEKVIESKVETKVVEDTDENGEIVTRIETEIVTEEVVRPAPDTGSAGGNQGGTSARTGDAAIVVIAVMIAAFGAAIAVKKISAK